MTSDAVMRMVAGAAFSFRVSGRLNLQLGADYSQKGWSGTLEGASSSWHLDYLEAGALLDVALGEGESASLRLLLGPTFGFRMSCQASVTAGGQTASASCDEFRTEERPKSTGGGVVGGLRAGIGVSDGMDLTIGAFYNFGVLGVLPDTGDFKVTNRTMTARVGFAYRIG